jgi:predicted transposase/invertase (TIGR01784 family)
VNIVYFALGQGEDYIYYGKTIFKGIHTNDTLQPSFKQQEDFNIKEISDIYPEYYILRVNKFNDIAKNSLDEWIYFLKNEEIKTNFKAKGLDKAKETLDIMKLEDKERTIYKRREENRMYKESLLYTVKVDGIKEGIKKGKEEGLKEGAKKAKIKIAQKLLSADMDIDFILETTGLSIEDIERIDVVL